MFASFKLSEEVETANAVCNAEIAKAYQKSYPNSGAEVLPIAGGYCIYLGENSPLTQVLGIGLGQNVSLNEIEEIEKFYFCKNSDVNIELSPYVEPALLEILRGRGYQLVEVSNVLVKDLNEEGKFVLKSPEIEITPVGLETIKSFPDVLARGFGLEGEIADLLKSVWEVIFTVEGNHLFLAKKDNFLAGGGCISIYRDIASFSGAATLPEFRKLGIQTKLLQYRLNLALELGCKLALISTLPGTLSQNNAERQGFRVIYTRIKLMKPFK
jgi:GNAT superfamily N-acetyltransferase